MQLSEVWIKVIGIILSIVGLGLLLAIVGVPLFGLGLGHWALNLVVGVVLLGAGIYIIRGGTISL